MTHQRLATRDVVLLVAVALASAYVLLSETLSVLELAGALLILLGLAVAVVRRPAALALLRRTADADSA